MFARRVEGRHSREFSTPMLTSNVFKNITECLFFGVLCLRLSHQKCFKNNAKCSRFCCFVSRFWCHFPSRGYPWSLPGSLGWPGGVPGRFFDGFEASRGWLLGSFGPLWAPLGLPWGDLGRHFGAKSGHKRVKKKASGAHCVPESILSAKREGPGPLFCDENIGPVHVFARGHSRHFGT